MVTGLRIGIPRSQLGIAHIQDGKTELPISNTECPIAKSRFPENEFRRKSAVECWLLGFHNFEIF